MWAEHFQSCLVASTREERSYTANQDWLVEILQTDFWDSRILTECTWQTVVLFPKRNGGLRGIGRIEVLWRLLSGVIYWWIGAAVQFHDVLHGFQESRGTGAASLKAKLLQQLTEIREEVLYEVFLDLRKSYDPLNRERCMEILVVYGVSTQTEIILQHYWYQF